LLVSASLSVAAGAAVGLATGCGGDDVAALPDAGGPDGAQDGTVEAAADTGSDVITTSDAGDAGADAQGDSGEDAQFDGAALGFPMQVAQAICSRIAACCFGQPDASVFNNALCLQAALPIGYQGSNEGTSLLQADGGDSNITFNPAAASKCLQEINAIDCTTNVLTSAQQAALVTDCFAALSGTVAAGSPCQDSIECAPGTYCQPPADGGAGAACASLREAGAPCGDYAGATAFASEQACSYRGSGNTNFFCHNEDLNTGNPLDAGTWTCMPGQPLDGGCNMDLECASKLCDPGPNFDKYQCVNSLPFAYMGACGTFAITDAGTD
jgi:hypothetical protein